MALQQKKPFLQKIVKLIKKWFIIAFYYGIIKKNDKKSGGYA